MTVTNAMRMLKKAGVPFETASYPVDEDDLSGVHAAQMMGIDPDRVFKTLVARGSAGLYVFCIPVAQELNLKKCAQVVGEKKIEMVHVKELLSLTGYVRGGCSPIGMKKQYPTVLDETALLCDTICVSAGKRGQQLILSPEDLAKCLNATIADVT